MATVSPWPRPTVTEYLGGMQPGEVRCDLGHCGLGDRGHATPPDVLEGPSGPVPRAVVRHVALEVALWEGGRDGPTVAEVARESGLDAASVRAALEVLARLTGYPLG